MLSALYYPFSRTINESSLKQMLLIFDSVCFLDSVDDDWRAFLFRQLEYAEDRRFEKYRYLYEPLKEIKEAGGIRIINPEMFSSLNRTTVSASAISDLLDPEWAQVASRPSAFGMPHRTLGKDNSPTWQIFQSKLPTEFIKALREEDVLRKHLIREGDINASWTLSYEAGSAASINVHLAAAEELALAPITDSPMHHQLLIRKAVREKYGSDMRPHPLPDNAVQLLANNTAIALVKEVLPKGILEKVTFDEVLKFREQTRDLRQELVSELKSRFSIISRNLEPENLIQAQREIQVSTRKELESYGVELADARAKIWPGFVSSLGQSLAGGSIAAVAFNWLGGAGSILIGSILAGSLALLKSGLDVKREMNKVRNSASPEISYLSKLVNWVA